MAFRVRGVGGLLLPEEAKPANPASGEGRLYVATDGTLHFINDAGADTALGAGGGGTPANMATTDTAQTIAGAKTFPVGALLMSNGAVTAEPYSDANPPMTLNLTESGANVIPTPPAGQATLYTVDGSTVLVKSDGGAVVDLGAPGGGGGGPDLTTEYGATTPTAPTAGIKLFTRHRARRMLAQIGPTGLDTALQPGFFTNRIARWNAVNNVAAPSLDGLAIANVGTPAATPVATTNFFTSMARVRFPTTATAAIGAGTRSNTAQWFMSSTPNMGGFFLVVRCGLNAVTAGQRAFIGMSSTITALAPASDPTALLNLFGFAINTGQTNWRFIHNDGAGAATAIDLGANFPTNAAATWFYEFRLFVPSGGGQNVFYSITRLNDGQFAQGVVLTDLPALNTLLSAHVHYTNGTTAAIGSIDIQSIYIESDN